ncbi:MAG: T9SS type A sorting domain-containing protein, partial [candidate division Zixibacteria bacterium]|nr:T9SS type A sorting domain-containing protein [candidate division Zixibacteria bacterium]
TITTIVNTGYYHLDGITQDNEGNIYFSTWQTNSVYMYDSLFSNPPELVFSNPNGAADIFYNKIKNELAIPVMWSNRIEFLQIPTSIDDDEEIQKSVLIELNQNYPNPFNSSTTINYILPIASDVEIEIYNILGQKVSTLIDKRQTAGYKNVTWNSSDYSSGIYFYKLTTENKTLTKRMTLLK